MNTGAYSITTVLLGGTSTSNDIGCGFTRRKYQCNTAVKPDGVLNGVTVARSHLQVNSGVRSTSVDRSITLQQEGINLVIASLIVISANNQRSV